MNSSTSLPGSARFAWWSALVVLLSAFLLFQVQPVISKQILPWFGGSPAVWTTCMLFFQVALLAGYAYAHWLSQAPQSGRQALIHVALLGVAIVLLPIVPGESWKPTGSEHPTTRILLLLSVCVGLPYFALSSTGPLAQTWFARVCPDRSPYWLYALSNIGSLGALLTYPFVIEPILSTRAQGIVWSIGFGLFALACGGLVLSAGRAALIQEILAAGSGSKSSASEVVDPLADLPPVSSRLLWLALPTLSTTALLAITNHLCQDVAVVPFLWIAPLSLYLLSFIVCFAGRSWYWPGFWSVLAAAAIVLVSALQLEWHIRSLVIELEWEAPLKAFEERFLSWFDFIELRRRMVDIGLAGLSVRDLNECIITHVLAYLTALFAICMVCHGELVRRKPQTRHLTSFYLMSSAGGALGGIIVALICPAVFRTYLELNWSLSLSFLVAWLVMIGRAVQRWRSGNDIWRILLAGYATLLLIALSFGGWLIGKAHVTAFQNKDLDTARSFYGVLHVSEVNKGNPSLHGRELLNGRILHGFQLLAPELRRQPTTYYTTGSGPAVAMETLRRLAAGRPRASQGLFQPTFEDDDDDAPPLPRRPQRSPKDPPIRFGVVGLGVGTMAAYGDAGDVVRFYEINPQVVDFATRHFSFITDCPGTVQIVPGDARLSMEREEPQNYDAIVLDAFAGDAIPVHLLTDEAIHIYRRHLKPTGVIVIHVSNRHLDLIPVVATLARHHQLHVALISHAAANDNLESTSDWMLVSANEDFMAAEEVIEAASGLAESRFQGPLWTDQHSNLFQILK